MKRLLLGLVTISISSNLYAGINLTKQMLDNDIETYEFQLFVSKTNKISIESLSSKVIFMGTYGKYQKFYKKNLANRNDLSQSAKKGALKGALQGTLNTLKSSKALQLVNGNALLKNAGMGMGIGLVVNPLAKMAFGDDAYVQVVDYYDGIKPKTRITKLIISDEGLPIDEQKMIFNTTNDESYHFNDGKIMALSSQGGTFNKNMKDKK